MGASQRVSRGFNRLAIFLAAIPLVIGTILSLGVAVQQANEEEAYQQKVVCAGQHPERWPATTAPKGSLADEQVGHCPLSRLDAPTTKMRPSLIPKRGTRRSSTGGQAMPAMQRPI
jgi:hypothetical protein